MSILLGVVIVIAAIIILVMMIYNKLVVEKNRYKNAFSQIDVQLTRRYDLIPNLVEVAKAYMAHERETLEAVISARNQAKDSLGQARKDQSSQSMVNLAQSEGLLGQTLGRLFALSESYPDLKANENMQQLSEEVASTENRVSFSRQAYNDCVMEYNAYREQLPNNIVASVFRFDPAVYLKLENGAAKIAPKIQF